MAVTFRVSIPSSVPDGEGGRCCCAVTPSAVVVGCSPANGIAFDAVTLMLCVVAASAVGCSPAPGSSFGVICFGKIKGRNATRSKGRSSLNATAALVL
eukprot:g2091.t1